MVIATSIADQFPFVDLVSMHEGDFPLDWTDDVDLGQHAKQIHVNSKAQAKCVVRALVRAFGPEVLGG